MLTNTAPLSLPIYQTVIDSITPLALSISGSELHGMMCGYLSAGAVQKGDAYLRALLAHQNDATIRTAAPVLFEVYAISQQQIEGSGFEFQLLLPDEEEPLLERVKSFSEWCDGFTQGIRMAGVDMDTFQDDDAQDAIEHITEFAELDYHSLQFDEDDERALTEISEYARMAVLHIYSDLTANHQGLDDPETTH
ncbi:MAG TPA: YecA family protein [Legionella sp.]|nr:YecA family protein [Legionella sp.]